ncbi:MAG: glutamate formimidoyltransferase [Bacteroidales bacterium]|nr:glutamate formimidoyltransferase [Bacteroidales bacterium]MDD2570696.1 glutamate formimidoyltransferase [Bacteroidales bacterium]MDD2813179.1 glutamate formimidoyltransferase [Bacteroidales bacterium]MDD3384911.1 glutamate formimidoyltransferase [Bacteroidales bacterium]MDD3811172.1 glutamate formimidoyltransferase [Bacteroidales bacterium]
MKLSNQSRLIECVPNFSEGNNMEVIRQITHEIESVSGVRLLDVDPGKATNRTVVTFVGAPEEVMEAAFRAIRKASEIIDMSQHRGEHPRFGATDVCPFVPVSGVTMDEAAEYARQLAKRVGDEIQIPVYCYEYAAFEERRRNLANVRSGEYEGLPKKLSSPEWKPDFGPATFVPHTGAIAIGARNFLVAYNINLNTTSVRRANSIAFDIREAGRVVREGDPITGPIVKGEDGEPLRIPGTLKKTKAIGWFIEEYGIAQISINLTDITVTPIHVAFEEASKKAAERGMRVTGSELVGLVPLEALLAAGRFYLKKQKRSVGIPEREIIKIAVKSLGLDDLKPFNPEEKIIEYILASAQKKALTGLTLSAFVDETASESPAPGGGSVAAYLGALGAALGTMVANLSAHKRGWDERWEIFSDWAEKGMQYVNSLTALVDEDTRAFNRVMDAFGLPKGNEKEKAARKQAIQAATQYATEVPLKVMELAYGSFDVIEAMAKTGNPNSISDAGVGALAARAAVVGAYLNVRINARDLDDRTVANRIIQRAEELVEHANQREKEVLKQVYEKL